jgi:ethanolamine ammonia-lyase small subunit
MAFENGYFGRIRNENFRWKTTPTFSPIMTDKIESTDPWQKLKQFTNARVALGNVGNSLPLKEVLALKLAHARAKDAIDTTLDTRLLRSQIEKYDLPFYEFRSQVTDRNEYLQRPDLGRKLSRDGLQKVYEKVDIVLVLTDGLSAVAVNKYCHQIVEEIFPEIVKNYSVAVVIVEQGRVAVGDEVAELFQADFVAVFIGERPGLSSPESMGIYTTFQAKKGFTDEKRNCISNIHYQGLSNQHAASLLRYLIQQSFALQLSGVALKIDSKLLS